MYFAHVPSDCIIVCATSVTSCFMKTSALQKLLCVHCFANLQLFLIFIYDFLCPLTCIIQNSILGTSDSTCLKSNLVSFPRPLFFISCRHHCQSSPKSYLICVLNVSLMPIYFPHSRSHFIDLYSDLHIFRAAGGSILITEARIILRQIHARI